MVQCMHKMIASHFYFCLIYISIIYFIVLFYTSVNHVAQSNLNQICMHKMPTSTSMNYFSFAFLFHVSACLFYNITSVNSLSPWLDVWSCYMNTNVPTTIVYRLVIMRAWLLGSLWSLQTWQYSCFSFGPHFICRPESFVP